MEKKLQAIFYLDDPDNYYLGHQTDEIFRTRIYQPFMKDGMTVMDLGANIGLFTLYASKYASKIYSVEPNLDNYMLLTKMVEFNGFTQVVPIQAAIDKDSGVKTFYHNTNKTMHSLSPAVNDNTTAPEMVRTATIEDIMVENNIEYIDLLKLDIEGAEYDVVGHESFSRIADRIGAVVGESHTWANRHPNQLKEGFTNRGFTFKWISEVPQLFVAEKKK